MEAEIKRKKTFIKDYLFAIKIANMRFRGSKLLLPRLRREWYDDELQKGIDRVERFFLPYFIGVIGLFIAGAIAMEKVGTNAVWSAMILWLIFCSLVISPLMFYFSIPKPVSGHVKDIDNLTEEEFEIEEKRKAANPRLERLLKRYRNSGAYTYKLYEINEEKQKEATAQAAAQASAQAAVSEGNGNGAVLPTTDGEANGNGSKGADKITNRDMICADCKYADGNSVTACGKYREKPLSVFVEVKCGEYEKREEKS